MHFDLEICSFVTIPNAFRQCAISLRRIHSASNFVLIMPNSHSGWLEFFHPVQSPHKVQNIPETRGLRFFLEGDMLSVQWQVVCAGIA